MKNNRGLTIIALVVSIVIILILAGISIGSLRGEKGLFARANQATTSYNNQVKGAQQEIDVIISDSYNNVNIDTTVENANVNITFSSSNEGWAQSIQIALSTPETGYTIQYSPNGTTWVNYTEPITITENGTIYARLVNGSETLGPVDKQITNIDNKKPSEFEITNTSSTSTSITVNGSTVDGEADLTTGASGIAGYKYKIDDEDWTDLYPVTAGGHVFDDLEPDSSHVVSMMAVDYAGNTRETTEVPVTTLELEPELVIDGNATITFATNTSEWVNGINHPVKVTITQNVNPNFTLQYRQAGTTEWTTYNSGDEITVNYNGTVIEARLVDLVNGVQNGEPTRFSKIVATVVENIDNLAPLNPVVTVNNDSLTDTVMTVSWTGTDAPATTGATASGISGIEKYKYQITGGSLSGNDILEVETTNTEYTFTGLEPNTEYTIRITAIDYAGNETTTTITQTTLTKVPDLVSSGDNANVVFTVTPSTWVNTDLNGAVLVTITENTNSGYTLQYSLDGTSWYNYNTAIPVVNNGQVVIARLVELINGQVRRTGDVASMTVANIDKLPPQSFAYQIKATTNSSVTLRAKTLDTPANETSGQSNISYLYGFSRSDLTETTNSTFTITGLTLGTPVNVLVMAKDEADNRTIATNSGDELNASEINKYYIYNKEDLEEFRDSVNNGHTYDNEIVYLMDNIDLGQTSSDDTDWWSPIGSVADNKSFNGTFEGNGYEISNLYGEYAEGTDYYAFFSNINGATINELKVSGNLKINNKVNNSDDLGIGGLIGVANGECTIEQCINNVSIQKSYSGGKETGGIIAKTAENSNVTVKDCTNMATLSGGARIGGIIGQAMGDVTLNNCHNTASITTPGMFVGGLISSSNATGNIVIRLIDCSNTANITGTTRVGGLQGCTGNTTSLYIENCYNTGIITANTANMDSYAGGIVGMTFGGENTELEIINTYNTGNVIGIGDKKYSGGILGQNGYRIANISNCYNLGNVEGVYASGITRSGYSSVNINNVYNAGIVTGTTQSASIGLFWSTTTAPNVKNTYYLTQTAPAFAGTVNSGDATAMTQNEMKSQSFADKLNDNITDVRWNNWIYIDDEYPTFNGEFKGSLPGLVEGENITFTSVPNYFSTYKTVSITIQGIDLNANNYTLQYRIDDGTYADYTDSIQVNENNSIVKARLIDKSTGQTGGASMRTITGIDHDAPTINTELTTSSVTSKTIITSINVTDDNSGLGKIIWYYKKSADQEWSNVTDTYQEPGAIAGEITAQTKTHIFTDLDQTTEFQFYAEVYDVAGNMISSKSSTNPLVVTTETVTALIAGTNITFDYSTSNWTNQNVIVTLTVDSAVVGTNTLRYKIGTNGAWTDYDSTNKITMTENETVYAVLYDGKNYGESAEGSVSRIDKTNPVVNTELASTSVGTNNIVLSVNVTDANSGLGKIIWYYKKASDQEWSNVTDTYQEPGATAGEITTQTKTHTFTDLDQTTEFQFYAEIYDVAGNKITSKSSTNPLVVTTETVTALTAGSNITFDYSTSNWTNQNVIVTLTVDNAVIGTNTLRYKIGTNGTWTDYDSTNKITMTGNETIYASLYDGKNYGASATGTVSKIDKINPVVNTELASTSVGTNNIVLSVRATDTNSGLGKIIWYYKKANDTEWQSVTDTYQETGTTAGAVTAQTKTHTFTDLFQTTDYQFYVEVYDVAGNKVSSQSATNPLVVTTETVTALTAGSNITFSYSTSNWTNNDVIVTLTADSATVGTNTLRYKIGTNGTWTDYDSTNKITMTGNETIYASLYDGKNYGESATGTVSKIDKTNPVVNTELASTSVGTNNIVLSVNVTDINSGLCEIIWYYKTSSDTEWQNVTDTYQPAGATAGAVTAQTKTHTFTDLFQTTEYQFYAEVYDVAGNKVSSKSSSNPLSVTTGTVTGLTSGSNITFSYSTSNWTNQNVIITLTIDSATVGTNTLRYKIGTSGTWTDYDSTNKITMTGNDTIYAVLYDGKNYGGSATGSVSKIDKINPVVNTELASTSVGTNNIVLSTNVIDANSGLGKIVWYYKKASDAEWQSVTDTYQGAGATAGAITAQTKTHTFTDLIQTTEYQFYAEVYDVAGNMITNKSASNPLVVTTETVTGLTSGSNITFIYSTSNWTNNDVIVTLTVDNAVIGSNTLRYKIGTNGTWTDYDSTNMITMTGNNTIYASLYDGKNYGASATGSVSKIDKVNPVVNTELASTSVGTNNIVLSVNVTDTNSGLGKIIWYYKSATDLNWQNVTDTYRNPGTIAGAVTAQTKTHTFTDLFQTTDYQFYVEVYDVAGNIILSKSSSNPLVVRTGTVTGLTSEANITYSYSTNNWTNNNVIVTLTVDNAVVGTNTLRYKIGTSGTWTDYNSTNKITMTGNDTIYASLYDGKNYGASATGSVNKIDKINPVVNTELASTSVGTNNIVLSVNVTDANSGLGKIIWYYKKTSDIEWQNVTDTYRNPGLLAGAVTAQTKTHTFTDLDQTTEYQFYAEVYDVAGNMVSSKSSSNPLVVTTETVTGLIDGVNIGLSYSETDWTNDDVIVSLDINSDDIGTNTLRYKIGENGTWTDCDSSHQITVTENGTIYVALYDGKNYGESVTGIVNNIDKALPVIDTELATDSISSSNIVVTMDSTDADSGLGKIIWYYKQASDVEWQSATDIYQSAGEIAGETTTQTKTHTFTDLDQTTQYQLYAEVYDVAGNMISSKSSSNPLVVTTETVTALIADSNIIFSYSTNYWTNNNITVTLTVDNEVLGDNILKYKIGTDGEWTTYNSTNKIVMTQNGTIYAALYDGKNYGASATGTVSKIDKNLPVINTELEVYSVGSTSATVGLELTDSDSGVKIIYWYYKRSNYSSWSYKTTSFTYSSLNGGDTSTQIQTCTFTGLYSGYTYQFYAEVGDVAGNYKYSRSSSSPVSALISSTYDIVANATNITLKVASSALGATGTTYQYQINGGAWQNARLTTDSSHTFLNLTPNTFYTVNVKIGDTIQQQKKVLTPVQKSLLDVTTIADAIKYSATAIPIDNPDYMYCKTLKDLYSYEVKIPVGFTVRYDSGTYRGDGIVIADANDNQWVWVPVTSSVPYARTAFMGETLKNEYTTEQIDGNYYYYEPAVSGIEASVATVGGFYIARYEAGSAQDTSSKTMRTAATPAKTVTLKRDQVAYNFVAVNSAKAGSGYGNATSLASGFASANGYKAGIVTKLCSSYAWNTTLNFTGNTSWSKGTGTAYKTTKQNYKDSATFKYLKFTNGNLTEADKISGTSDGPMLTGQGDARKNIYDMGGNCYEFTSELYSKNDVKYVLQGGGFDANYSGAPSGQRYPRDGVVRNTRSFRPVMYLPAPTVLTNADVIFDYSTTDWTNQNVIVGLTLTDESIKGRYKLVYKLGSNSWQEYNPETKITVSSNYTIYAALSDGGTNAGTATGQVSIIDKSAPTIRTSLSKDSVTDNKINVSVEARDTLSGIGKVEWYYKKTGDSEWIVDTVVYQEPGAIAGTTSYKMMNKTFSNLEEDTEYGIYVKIYDVAGNMIASKTESSPLIVSTVDAFKLSPNATSITVNVDKAFENADNIQYQINGGEWISGRLPNDLTYTFMNLTPETEYTINIKVDDEVKNAKVATTNEQKSIKDVSTIREAIEHSATAIPADDPTYPELFKELDDDLGNDVKIPVGFTVRYDSSTYEEKGVVIADANDNQWVWIPVSSSTSYVRTGWQKIMSFDSNNMATGSYKVSDSNYFSETPSPVEANVLRAGGYYIGRYEAGSLEDTNAGSYRTAETSAKTVTIKRDYIPYNYIAINSSEASTNCGNIESLADGMATANGYRNGIVTQLCSCYGWDTALNFINDEEWARGVSYQQYRQNYFDTEGFYYRDLTGPGTYTVRSRIKLTQSEQVSQTSVMLTGQGDATCNIYDLAGNCFEYTSESYSNVSKPYVYRGGVYNKTNRAYSAGYRESANAGSTATIDRTFRMTMYLDLPKALNASNTTFEYSTTNWTNEDIIVGVDIDSSVIGTNTVRYKIGMNGTWQNYDSVNKIRVTQNDTVYVALYDGYTYGDSATATISKIDKVDPIINTELNASVIGGNEVTLSTGVCDNSSGIGQIIWYWKEKDGVNWESTTTVYRAPGSIAGSTTSQTKTCTITDLLPNTTYQFYIEFYDVAGNMIKSKSELNPLELTTKKYFPNPNATNILMNVVPENPSIEDIYEYQIDDGEWVTSRLPNETVHVFDNLTPNTQHTVNVRINGVEEGPLTVTTNTQKSMSAVSTVADAIKYSATPIAVNNTSYNALYTVLTTSDGEVKIPIGFTVRYDSGKTINEGIVVADANDNQWVWIPVNENNPYVKTAYKSETLSNSYTTEKIGNDYYYYEPAPASVDPDFDLATSIGGYYIARYEAGSVEDTASKTFRSGETSARTVSIKQDQVPYSNVAINSATASNGYGNCTDLSAGIATANGYKTGMVTKLCSAHAWDTALNFIGNSSWSQGTGNGYQNIKQNYLNSTAFKYLKPQGGNLVVATKTSGSNNGVMLTGQGDSTKNIYDMGGNCLEYSTESYSDSSSIYVRRGGNCESSYGVRSAGSRIGDSGNANNNYSFRPVLYLPTPNALTASNVTFNYSTTNWTNQNVIVTLTIDNAIIASSTIRYKIGTYGTWTDYDSVNGITMTSNGTIYVALYNGLYYGDYTTGSVSKIDKTNPSINSSISSNELNTARLTVTDSSSGIGKIIWYYKAKGDTQWQSETTIYMEPGSIAGTTSRTTYTHVYENLSPSVEQYYVYAEVYDVAGNHSMTSSPSYPCELYGPVQANFDYQYGGLARKSDINQDLFTYTIITNPSGTTNGTARVDDINWRYFAEYVLYDEYWDEGDYHVIEEWEWENVASYIQRLVIPYEVTIDNKKYDITELERLVIPSNDTEFCENCPWNDEYSYYYDTIGGLATGSYNFGEDDYAFSYLIIPSSVKKVVSSHHGNWEKAIPRDYVIFSPNSELTEIDNFAFYANWGFEELIVPDGCTKLGYRALHSCSSLGQIYIPKSVTEIGGYCFTTEDGSTWDWAPAIDHITIYYEGTEEEWNNIVKGQDITYYPDDVTILYNQKPSDMRDL